MGCIPLKFFQLILDTAFWYFIFVQFYFSFFYIFSFFYSSPLSFSHWYFSLFSVSPWLVSVLWCFISCLEQSHCVVKRWADSTSYLSDPADLWSLFCPTQTCSFIFCWKGLKTEKLTILFSFIMNCTVTLTMRSIF